MEYVVHGTVKIALGVDGLNETSEETTWIFDSSARHRSFKSNQTRLDSFFKSDAY
jgi:hypothetical protein